ncbi:MAG: acyltransferase [Chlorobiaceae bacterium]
MRKNKAGQIAEKNFYYPFIDGLRGIAVLMVLLVHTSQRVGNDYVGSFKFHFIETFVNAGARGVQLFFIISAFTLYNSTRSRYKSDRYPIINFAIRRAFRILPFWWVMVVMASVLIGSIYDIPRVLSNMFFLFGFIRYKEGVELVTGGWSLFVEETFYMMLPIIFLLIDNRRRAFYLFVITFAISLMWLVLAPLLGVSSDRSFIDLFPLTYWFAFAIGINLYFVMKSDRFQGFITSGFNANIFEVATWLIILLILRGHPIGATFSFIFIFLSCCSEKTFLGHIARSGLMMRFGVYCYSIYLFQFPLLDALDPYKIILFNNLGLSGASVDVKLLIYFPVVAMISLFLAFFTFNLIELPFLRLGKIVNNKCSSILSAAFAI